MQNKILRCICHKFNIPRTPHTGYEQILKLLNLETYDYGVNFSFFFFLKHFELDNVHTHDIIIVNKSNLKDISVRFSTQCYIVQNDKLIQWSIMLFILLSDVTTITLRHMFTSN